MKYHVIVRFKLRYVWIGIAAIIVIGVILFYLLHIYGVKYGFSEIATYLIGLVAILTLLYHAFNLENQINNQENNNKILKSKYTYDMIAKWNEVEMTKSATVIKSTISDHKDDLSDSVKVKQFSAFLDNKKNIEIKRDLILILNYFETISIMIENDHFERKIAKAALKDMFVRYYNDLKNYINYRQDTASNKIWCTYERLVKKWIEKEKKLS